MTTTLRRWRNELGDLVAVAATFMPAAVWRRRRAQRDCFHHDPVGGKSFLRTCAVTTDGVQHHWCTACHRHWA